MRNRMTTQVSRRRGIHSVLAVSLLATVACGRFEARRQLKAGNRAYTDGKYPQAIEAYDKVSADYRDGARAALNTGYAHWKQYRFGSSHAIDREHAAKAVAAFDRYLKIRPAEEEDSDNFPGVEKIKERIITLLIDSERYEDAIARLEIELQGKPDDPALLRGIATTYDKWSKPTMAVRYYQKWSAKFPQEASPHVAIAAYSWNMSFRRSQELEPIERNRWIDIGIEAADAALKVDPEHFEGLTYRNLLLRERAKVRTDPDQVATLLKEANEVLARAKAVREKQKAAEEAAKAEQEKKKAAEPAKDSSS